MTDEELGAIIRLVRQINRLSQSELAEAVESSQKHISRIENGLSSPTFGMLNRISGALNTDIRSLLNVNQKSFTGKFKDNEEIQ